MASERGASMDQSMDLDALPLSTADANDDSDVECVSADTMLNYMNGLMTFEEYAHILEQGIKEEPPDEFPSETTVLPISHSRELDSAVPQKEPPSIRKRTPRFQKVPKHLQGLVGEANAKFAMNEFDEAERMCLEVIRSAPNLPQPFNTLAMIYEERQDMEKCLQFMLIAAHLRKTDAEEWKRVGDFYVEHGDKRQAVLCYEKARKFDPSNASLTRTLCDLLLQLGEVRKRLVYYQQLLLHMDRNVSNADYMNIVRQVVLEWHELKEKDRALSVMEQVLECRPHAVESQDINVLLELYIGKTMYDRSLEILIQFCSVAFHYNVTGAYDSSQAARLPLPTEKPVSCRVPVELPIDLRSKLIVCLIHLQYHECVDEVIAPMKELNVASIGDLYMDVVEAYMACGHYSAARPILSALVETDSFNKAVVWLRYAECLNAMHESLRSVEAYEKVVELAPSHYQARLSLSGLHQQLGNTQDALRVLKHHIDVTPESSAAPESMSADEENVRLLVARCYLLQSQNEPREFAECAQRVLFGFCCKVFDDERYRNAVVDYKKLRNRIAAFSYTQQMCVGAEMRAAGIRFTRYSMTSDELWSLYLKLCNALFALKEYEELEKTSIVALLCPQFTNDTERAAEADFMCLCACLLNRNGTFAYAFIRILCSRNLDNARAWNLFNQVVTLSRDLRHNRFCIRLAMKYPNNLALIILNGNNAMVAGSYKHALGEYIAALRHIPNDPLLNLLVALCFVHMASQKFVQKHHALTVQSTAFLNQYIELRGNCQESYYNAGRAFHQVGLCHFAADYYRKGLACPPAIRGREQFDLSRELAFNLMLIYKNSKSFDLAREVMQQYLRV